MSCNASSMGLPGWFRMWSYARHIPGTLKMKDDHQDPSHIFYSIELLRSLYRYALASLKPVTNRVHNLLHNKPDSRVLKSNFIAKHNQFVAKKFTIRDTMPDILISNNYLGIPSLSFPNPAAKSLSHKHNIPAKQRTIFKHITKILNYPREINRTSIQIILNRSRSYT